MATRKHAARVFVLFAILSSVFLWLSGVDAQKGDSGSIVRLVNGSSSSEGRVEIRVNGTWGTVCDPNFTFGDAQVVCRMLRYATAEKAIQPNHYGTGEYPPVLTSVKCIGFEESIFDCSISYSSCLDTTRAGVKCSNDSVDVRLVDGSLPSEGRLEVFHSGEWGTVCSNSFTIVEAHVACHHLGYSGAVAYHNDTRFGQGNGHIWIDNLQCPSSNLTSIADCAHSGWGLYNCSHNNEISVVLVCTRSLAPLSHLQGIVAPSTVGVLLLIVVVPTCVVGFLLWRRRNRQFNYRRVTTGRSRHDGHESMVQRTEVLLVETTGSIDTSHEPALKRLCYMPFDINITCAPQEGGVFDLVPSFQGVIEGSGGEIQVEVSRSVLSLTHAPFTLRHAVLVDGPFQLPEGYQLTSDVVYLYSDPSQPVRPFILHLPHWYTKEEEEEGGSDGDSLTFVTAPHTPSQHGENVLYKFELQRGGSFPMPSIGSLLVSSHSTLFAIAYKEKITSKLKYYATHLDSEDVFGLKIDVAITFASTTWQKILKIHRKSSIIKKAVPFNFQSPQNVILAHVDEIVGRSGRASLEGSSQVHKDEVRYRSHGIESAEQLGDAVKAGTYPPTLSFVAAYNPALKWNGQPALLKVYVDRTSKGRLCFSSIVYEEKEHEDRSLTTDGPSSSPAAVPSMILLQDYSPQLADKWEELGNALGLEHQVCALQSSSKSSDRCVLALLSAWVSAGDRNVGGVRVEVSWEFLVRVLRSPAVNKGSVASTIEDKYIHPGGLEMES